MLQQRKTWKLHEQLRQNLPSGSALECFLFFFSLGSNTVAKTPCKKQTSEQSFEDGHLDIVFTFKRLNER